jgi:hypothetical protein
MNRSGVDQVNSEGGERMGYVLAFQEIDHAHVAVVGGKAHSWGSFRGSKASPCRLDCA